MRILQQNWRFKFLHRLECTIHRAPAQLVWVPHRQLREQLCLTFPLSPPRMDFLLMTVRFNKGAKPARYGGLRRFLEPFLNSWRHND